MNDIENGYLGLGLGPRSYPRAFMHTHYTNPTLTCSTRNS